MSKPLGWFAAFLAMLALGLGIDAVYDASKAPESNVAALSSLTPTMPYPMCEEEDGAGVALCMFDGTGNGVGEWIISGDCALDITGSAQVQAMCRALHNQDAYTITNDDGSMRSEPNGSFLVQECNDIENQADNDSDAREVLNAEGWNLSECYKAMMR
jgi:hypothetical protein